MPKYRVKPGVTFGPAGIYPAGTVVELTVEEAKGFLDKLIPLDGPATDEPKAVPRPAVRQPQPLKNEFSAEVPESQRILRPESQDSQKILRKKQSEE